MTARESWRYALSKYRDALKRRNTRIQYWINKDPSRPWIGEVKVGTDPLFMGADWDMRFYRDEAVMYGIAVMVDQLDALARRLGMDESENPDRMSANRS